MRRQPRRDLIAGVTVAVVALPLALAFGISSGLGAGAGLVTAVVAGVLAASFGGSNLQVSGPTGAMTVVLIPIVAKYGPSGVLVVGLLAGLALIGLAFAGAGRAMRYVPLPVIEGFTLGIAVIIGLQQVPAALGVTQPRQQGRRVDGQGSSGLVREPHLGSTVNRCRSDRGDVARRSSPPGLPGVVARGGGATAWSGLRAGRKTIGALPTASPPRAAVGRVSGLSDL